MINIDMELAGSLCAIIAVAAKVMLLSAFAIGLTGIKKEIAQRQVTQTPVARLE